MSVNDGLKSDFKYDVCVIGGCGHVGLPLSIALADKGLNVIIYDINEKAIATVSGGVIPFFEEDAEPVLKKVLDNGKLTLSNDLSAVSESESIVLIIGTPVDEHLNPKFRVLIHAIEAFIPNFRNGQTLILRSTLYPGISKRIDDWLKEAGLKMNVCFCPERIVEGKAMKELYSLPQIISSFTDEGLDKCREIFGLLTPDLIVANPVEAELSKLFTNVWRYIKFSVANQFYMIANDYGIDFYNVYHAVTHKYDRAKDLPKPGLAAGPCLFKDAMQLAAFNNSSFYLGHAAMLVNEGMPNYIVQKLKEKFVLENMTVGILGMAFKADIDDPRESLSYKLLKILELQAKRVLCSDPFVRDSRLVDRDYLIEQSEIIIVATPHTEYKSLKIEGKIIADIWNVFGQGGKI